MKKTIVVLLLQIVLFSSCIDKFLGHKYVATIDDARKMLKQSYAKETLLDHFPQSISDKSVLHIMYTIPDTVYAPEEVYYTGFVYLVLKMGEDSLSVYPKSYLYKTQYNSKNFILDDSFKYYKYYDTLRLRNVNITGAYPIPYFRDFDFGLGSERFDLRSLGMQMVIDVNKVPDDLEVFVLKAEHGYFWRKKFDLERPETLGIWKNGYSCGVAISKKQNIIIYWMKAW